MILHLIFDHYDEAVLLLYQSAGSSLEGFFDTLVARKIEESAAFFRSTGYAGVDEQLLGLVISVQFDSYRRIIASCRDRETAERYMNALMVYHSAAGPHFLTPRIIQSRRAKAKMKYNGFYYWMFESSMKKVLVEKYGKQYANEIMRKSKKTYRELVEKADDIGDGNPMAYNELLRWPSSRRMWQARRRYRRKRFRR